MVSIEAVTRVLKTWCINALNLFIFIISYGTHTVHEGRFYKFLSTWSNWNLYFKCQPKRFEQPTSERQIRELVRGSRKVRVVASGHSFNPGNLSNDTLISLDKYNKVVDFDKKGGRIIVQCGIRLRDFIKVIEDAGFDIPVMGTTNAQSIGGLIASDLHAMGRETGYLAQQLVALRIIDGKGEVAVFTKESDVFRAAIGGIGAMGIVVEATIQLVPRFLCRRVVQYVERCDAESALERLLAKHDHVGFFYIGGLKRATKLRLSTFDYAFPYEQRSKFAYLRNYLGQIFDMINGGFLLDLSRYFPFLLNIGYFTWNNTFFSSPFVDYAGAAFTSRLFFRHDEMEYGLPIKNFRKAIGEMMDYLEKSETLSLLEVRFCVNRAQTNSLLGPGAGRDTVFIEILPTTMYDTRSIFVATENIFDSNSGRPHLGKYTTYQQPDMRKHFGDEAVDRFLEARERQDPQEKFVNSFVHQVFLATNESNPALPLF